MNRTSALLLVLFFISCTGGDKKTRGSQDTTDTARQQVLEPVDRKIFWLPPELKEISGISFVNDSLLVAIQDERGILFFYDLNQEKVVRTYEFGKGKDYEDLAVVGSDLFIVNSSGTLYQLQNFMQPGSEPVVYKTQLTSDNNIEGLAYDKSRNRLLLAVKDKSLDNRDDHKGIYEFDLASHKLNPEPVYSIELDEVESYFKGDQLEEFSKKLLKAVGNENLNEIFRTSALNFDPKSGNLYVLSSLNNIIAVLNREGKIIRMLEFDGKEFSQPEGLAFTSTGKLFISNEGRKKQANIIEVMYEK